MLPLVATKKNWLPSAGLIFCWIQHFIQSSPIQGSQSLEGSMWGNVTAVEQFWYCSKTVPCCCHCLQCKILRVATNSISFTDHNHKVAAVAQEERATAPNPKHNQVKGHHTASITSLRKVTFFSFFMPLLMKKKYSVNNLLNWVSTD